MEWLADMEWSWEIWWWASLGALMIGLGKGGLSGFGNLTVMIYAQVFPAKESVGILLPVLIAGDLVAVAVYRRHTRWEYLIRLFPWLAAGMLTGYFSLGWLDNAMMKPLIGWIVLIMAGLHFLRIWAASRAANGDRLERMPHHWIFRCATGMAGGFATTVANAAGPVAALYFLAVGLPKMEFIGTGAWAFCILNWIKVPLFISQDLITFKSMAMSLTLMPWSALGAALAPLVVKRINQRLFEALIWVFVIAGGIKLLIG